MNVYLILLNHLIGKAQNHMMNSCCTAFLFTLLVNIIMSSSTFRKNKKRVDIQKTGKRSVVSASQSKKVLLLWKKMVDSSKELKKKFTWILILKTKDTQLIINTSGIWGWCKWRVGGWFCFRTIWYSWHWARWWGKEPCLLYWC